MTAINEVFHHPDAILDLNILLKLKMMMLIPSLQYQRQITTALG